MDNDIRPPERLQPLHIPKVEDIEPKATNSAPEPVDEQKIEAEFGPPPETAAAQPWAASKSTNAKKGKVMKLLPAMTIRHHNKKKLLIMCGIALAILLIAGAASYLLLHRYNPQVIGSITPKKYIPPKPKIVPSTLTGLPVDPSVNDRTVTAIMIENSIDARPQSGLDQAGVVFEALAEGGVTRFMALFQDTSPDYIGPVRSARPYYIQWALGFDAAYAHVGGSPDALADIGTWHVKDLNQFYNAGAFQRISTRFAPHNVYTSIAQLAQVEAAKGFGKSNYTGFVRKPKETPSKTPNATSIDTHFSGGYYDSHYDYDPATNTYKRSEAGAPHLEVKADKSQTQIAPKVVVAMIVPETSGALDSSGAYYSNYTVTGTGTVYVFQDGTVQTGTWTKADNNSQIVFKDANGKPLALNPGQTWVAALANTGALTYK